MNPLIGIFIRHELTLAGGWLVQKGVVDAEGAREATDYVVGHAGEIVAGGVAVVTGIGLSVWNKIKNGLMTPKLEATKKSKAV